ncbi:MAG TPA: hypothetical protein VFE60_13945 [Roseiarcus sp.]|nr:hypothetical protein [Roseiarcus sp.]
MTEFERDAALVEAGLKTASDGVDRLDWQCGAPASGRTLTAIADLIADAPNLLAKLIAEETGE